MSDANDFRRDPTRTADTTDATPDAAFAEAPPAGLVAIGASFGRYHIVSLLGVGGLGEVYRARDTHLQRDVALKLVRPTPNASKSAADRVLREARIAATLVHPNVVQIFDVGEIDGIPFLAMELIEGTSLRAYIGKDVPPLAQRVEWLIAIAHALDAAHRQGIVHRDVKPDNVMIREDGIVKVVDFGIAHIGDEAKRTVTISRKGIAMGTPAYMAPEQLRGERVDARTDQFAWGVLAYELLDGHRPWRSPDPVALVEQILTGEFPGSSRIPNSIAGVVARSVSKEAAGRYGSMSSLVSTLETRLRSLRPDESVGTWIEYRLIVAPLLLLLFFSVLALRDGVGPRPSTSVPTKSREPALTRSNAKARFDSAMTDFWEGSIREAQSGFEQAVSADPNLGVAHLWAALLSHEPDARMRDHLLRAGQLRSGMTARDIDLLQCVEPWRAEPPAWDRSVDCLDDLIGRRPDDAVPSFIEAWVLIRKGSYKESVSAAERAIELDSRFGSAHNIMAEAALFMGDELRYKRALRECRVNAPASTACLRLAVYDADWEGFCAEGSALTEQLIRLAPDTPYWYQVLANIRFAENGDVAEARRYLSRQAALTPEPDRRLVEFNRDTKLAILDGRFDVAAERAAAWERAVDQNAEEMDHLRPFRARSAIALELGDPRQAISFADAYARRQPAWAVDDFETGTIIYPLIAKHFAGAVTRETFRRERARWLEIEKSRARKNGSAHNLPNLWLLGYAWSVKDSVDALEALAALPEYSPLWPPEERGLGHEFWIARTYRLAGRNGEARQSFGWVTRGCEAVNFPFEQTWGFEEAAMLFESSGDVAGACQNYARVLARWGREPRSVTARQARAGWERLHCAGSRLTPANANSTTHASPLPR